MLHVLLIVLIIGVSYFLLGYLCIKCCRDNNTSPPGRRPYVIGGGGIS